LAGQAEKEKSSGKRTVAIIAVLLLIIVLVGLLWTTTRKANTLLIYYLGEDIRKLDRIAAPPVPPETVERIRSRWERMRSAVERGDADLEAVAEARRALARAGRDDRLDEEEAARLDLLMARW
jgi:hypothetical protein